MSVTDPMFPWHVHENDKANEVEIVGGGGGLTILGRAPGAGGPCDCRVKRYEDDVAFGIGGPSNFWSQTEGHQPKIAEFLARRLLFGHGRCGRGPARNSVTPIEAYIYG